MTKIAEALGRVMMTAVRLPRSLNLKEEGYRKYAEIEYGKDSAYVYNCMINQLPFNVR